MPKKPKRGYVNPITGTPTSTRGKTDPRTGKPKPARPGGTAARRPKPKPRGKVDPRTGTPKPRPRRGTADPRAGTPKPKPSRNVAHSGGIGTLGGLESFRKGLDRGLRKAGSSKAYKKP